MAIRQLGGVAPITADDDAIAKALEHAHIPALMCALVHITGDAGLVRGNIRPEISFFGDEQGNIAPQDQQKIRGLALDVLRRLRDGAVAQPPVDRATVAELVDFIVGRPLPSDYGDFLHAELMLNGDEPYRPQGLDRIPAEQRAAFKVIVIGAGMSGLLAAIRLQEAGIPFEIVERHDEVGGTWYQNTYPGCRVDSPNHIYSYSFRPADWPQYYSSQAVLRDYFDGVAAEYGLKRHIRFGTEVTEARFDDASCTWEVFVRRRDGTEDVLRANAVISAVGQLNRPKWPDIPGQDKFRGIAFHSTEWEHEHDLAGRKILVIGTGASAFQFAPEIAKVARKVTIFQRTPPWMAPVPHYHDDVPPGKHWLLNHVPYYGKWYRFAMFWNAAEGILFAVRKDPAWNGENSISAENDQLRQAFTDWIRELCDGDEDLLQKAVPRYPVGGKRILMDNGNWLRALRRDNVTVETDPIVEITETGVLTKSGARHDADVLIYGTGFQASRFLWPMKVTGRGGVDLQEHWDGDPRAYLGITIPGFPNLFCCYGPNTNIVVNGSIIFFSECEVRYILGCIRLLLEDDDRTALDCRQDVHDEYNRTIDQGNLEMAWGAANVPTWYKNERGRVTQNWPFSLVEYWKRTQAPDPADYRFLTAD